MINTLLSLFFGLGIASSQPKIEMVDTAQTVERVLPVLRSQGVSVVGRYYMRNAKFDKAVSAREARAISLAGMRLIVVYEGPGDKAWYFTYEAGLADGRYSLTHAEEIGQSGQTPVYFAVDFDATPEQIQSGIIPYFQGVREGLRGASSLRIGVYGSGRVASSLLRAGLVQYVWIAGAMKWAGTQEFLRSDRWHILQGLPTTYYGGIDTDPDTFRVSADDAGAFVPFRKGTGHPPGSTERPQSPQTPDPTPVAQKQEEQHPSKPSEDLWFFQDWWKFLKWWWNS